MRSIFLAALLVWVGSLPAWGQNLVVNGTFEAGDVGWTTWRADWGSNEAWDFTNTQAGHLGTQCLQLGDGTTTSSFGVFQEVAVTPGRTYRIDAYWKGQRYGSSNWAEIILLDGPWDQDAADHATDKSNFMYAYDQPDNPWTADFGWIWGHDQNGTPVDWNGRNGERTASGSTMTVVLKGGACCGTQGVNVWFDNVSLVEVDPPGNRVFNGDFTNDMSNWTPWIVRDDNTDFTAEVTSGELSISGSDIDGGVYQQFNTGGAGNVVTVTGSWRSDPTIINAMFAEVWVINASRAPIDGIDETDGVNDAILLYRNDTFSGRGAWNDAIPKSAPVNHEVSFVAAGPSATLILKTGNTGPATLTGTKFDNIEVRSVPAPATLGSLPSGFQSRTYQFPSAHMVSMAQSPVSREIYAISNESNPASTKLYRVDVDGPAISSVQIPLTGCSGGVAADFVQAITFDRFGDMYISTQYGKIIKGRDQNADPAVDDFCFEQILDLPDLEIGTFHGVGGVAVGLDDMLYINSGSETHYGYKSDGSLEDLDGTYNSRILRCSLEGGIGTVETFCEGIRNSFDISFRYDGTLFGVENGPNINCDYAEEFNSLEGGQHYGFPYKYGSDISGDDSSITCSSVGPEGPPPLPGGLVTTAAWANYGPDAKPGPGDLGYVDGQEYYGFDPHRSPDGLDFYEPQLMDPAAIKFPAEFHGRAFVAHFGELEPITPVGHDVTSLRLDDTNRGFVCNRFLGFSSSERPIDVLCAYNGKLYILEYSFGGSGELHEISYTLATSPIITLDKSSIDVAADQGASPAAETFLVANSGTGSLDYSISIQYNDPETGWADVDPDSGSSTGEADTIDVTFATDALDVGNYSASIQVSDPQAQNSPQSIDLNLVIKSVLPDFDGDLDVDQDDYAFLQMCYNGSGGAIPPGCGNADLDGDGDVDPADETIFAGCQTQADVRADATCDDPWE